MFDLLALHELLQHTDIRILRARAQLLWHTIFWTGSLSPNAQEHLPGSPCRQISLSSGLFFHSCRDYLMTQLCFILLFSLEGLGYLFSEVYTLQVHIQSHCQWTLPPSLFLIMGTTEEKGETHSCSIAKLVVTLKLTLNGKKSVAYSCK